MNTINILCAIIIITIIIIVWYILRKFRYTRESFSETIVMELPNIKKYQSHIEKCIDEDLLKATQNKQKLYRMCAYAVSGGKKIRSIIIMSILNNPDNIDYSNIAIAVEYLHAASLILDDIADKDNYRRGRPSVHKMFGIGKAQMCALYLIGHAGMLLQQSAKKLSQKEDFIIFIYDNLFSNLRKLIDGQYIDISDDFGKIDLGKIDLGDQAR